MEKIKVAVLFGGQSTEHAVSLQSACAVLHAMKGTRFEAVPVGITREGRWFWYRGPLDAVGEGVWEKEECAPVTLTPDASVHGLLVQGAGNIGKIARHLAEIKLAPQKTEEERHG